MLGLPHGPGERALQRSLETEARRHQDIVQGNVLDTYRNLTFKSVMGHLWVSQFCRQAELVVKADDDIYVDLYGTFTVASRHFQDQVSPPTAALQPCSPPTAALTTQTLAALQGRPLHDGTGQQAGLHRGHQVPGTPLEQVAGVVQ